MSSSVVVCLTADFFGLRIPDFTHRNHLFHVSPVATVPKVLEQLINLNAGISILFIMNVLHLVLSATAVNINLCHIFFLHVTIHEYFYRWRMLEVITALVLLLHSLRRTYTLYITPVIVAFLQAFTHTKYIRRITAILISRLLLELQEANHTVVKLDTDDPSHPSRNTWDSSLSFLSSIGGFINSSRSAQLNDDDLIELQVSSPSVALREEKRGVPAEVPEAAMSPSLTM